MKAFFSLALVICSITLTACTGWDGTTYGTIVVKKPFTIKGEERNLYVNTGVHHISVSYENGVYGITNPQLQVHYKDKTYGFDVPRSAFDADDKSVDATSDQIGQSFSIKGGKNTITLRSWTEEGTRSCTHCSYCFSNQTKIDSNGNTTTSYEYGHSCSCTGTQDVLYRKTAYQDSYILKFTSEKNETLATFTGKAEEYTRKWVESTLGSCN